MPAGARDSLIHPFTAEYDDYRHDESRRQGAAEDIAFPRDEAELRAVMAAFASDERPVTVQGARTGLAAGAVPAGGHVVNLSRQTRYLGLRRDEEGRFYLRVQPGVVLSDLRKHLRAKDIPAVGWDEVSLDALAELTRAPEQMFPTDPTETSACLGGMAACNASGARSYRYGAMRDHVTALRLVLADGDVLALTRGSHRARGRHLHLVTEGGRAIDVVLPGYQMPACKNASGYYVADDVDAVDVVIGSDGTLGIISELELALMPAPSVIWGVSCFFTDEDTALDATVLMREQVTCAAIEYFDGDALDVLRAQRLAGGAFAQLDEPPASARACLYVELHAAATDEALEQLRRLAHVLTSLPAGTVAATWVARTDSDRERLQFFRHAVPESVNMLIDRRRRTAPGIAKLGSDMAVPDERLRDAMHLYREGLAAAGLQSAVWGHIGNNHLHVNVLPRTLEEFERGHELFAAWARTVSAWGGAVSAEHGVGKIKRDFLRTMYGEDQIRAMARLKLAFDPGARLGRGNLFDEALLDDERVRAAAAADVPVVEGSDR